MSDVPTASTSTASTSTESPASTSRIHLGPYHNKFRNVVQDIDLSLSSESEVSEVLYDSEESVTADEESSTSSDEAENSDGDLDETADDESSWSSITSSATSSAIYSPVSSTISSTASSVVSCEDKSSSDHSETESSVLRDRSSDDKSITDDEKHEEPTGTTGTTPILILVQMNEIGTDLINENEHGKRLKSLEKELDFIESTEWMYRPIDSAIRYRP